MLIGVFMNNQLWITLIVSALTDFSISAGGAYLAATSSGVPVTLTIITACVVTGVISAARGVQKLLAPTLDKKSNTQHLDLYYL